MVRLSLLEGVPLPPALHRRGRPDHSAERLILKALLGLLVCRVWRVHGLLALLADPTAPLARVRAPLTDPQGRCPSRRTWERRRARLAGVLPAGIALLGAWRVRRLHPWPRGGRAVASASSPLRARGGVLLSHRTLWHQAIAERDLRQGLTPFLLSA